MIVILASREGWHTEELRRAFAQRGRDAVVAPYQSLVLGLGRGSTLAARGHDLRAAEAVVARIIPAGSLEQIIFRVDALHALEALGVRVVNGARAIERSVNKALCSFLLAEAGLPSPETIACETVDDAWAAWRALGQDVIVKPLFGSMGLGMVRVSEEELAWRTFRVLEEIRGVFYLQRAVTHPGRDIRAFVVGNRVIGAIERRAPGWRTNVSRGGTARAVALADAELRLACAAAEAVGAEYAGVDLLPSDDGTTYVLEVNGIPGWEGLQRATGLDVADAIAGQLLGGGT